MRLALFIILLLSPLFAENLGIMTLDSLADVYYDTEGVPVTSDEIKALDGQEIRLAGYMVPFNDLENLKEFMLMPSSNGCNFCEVPAMEEMVYVRQAGKKKYKFIGDPLVITGKLWVQGAGTPAKNSTYSQFLYALTDVKVESMKAADRELLEKVTPRTILKQVCSLLRVRLLKQVRFKALTQKELTVKKRERLLEYLGGEQKAQALQSFLQTMGVYGAEEFITLTTNYLSNWSGAFCNEKGDTLYHLEGLDFSKPENQFQIAMASYDVLFHHEIDLNKTLLGGAPTYDESLARLSLVLGLRQSFSQFYGSIGLVDLKPLEEFTKPFKKASLINPYKEIASQLLVRQAGFIAELYKTPRFQPYTLALQKPPVAMDQILTPSLYMDAKVKYKAKILDGYENCFGRYLTCAILGEDYTEYDGLVDGITFGEEGFNWEIHFPAAEQVTRITQKLSDNQSLVVSQNERILSISSKK